MTQGERIAALEVENRRLRSEVTELREEVRRANNDTNEKLDELLALRNKGYGVFWLATSLAGAGVLSLVLQFFGFKMGVG